jgi:hypothetical protein
MVRQLTTPQSLHHCFVFVLPQDPHRCKDIDIVFFSLSS